MILQIRRGRKPDGVCLVVGTCARGFKNNSISDVIFSSSTVKKVGDSKAQYFWEVIFFTTSIPQFLFLRISLKLSQAFPAGSGPLDRTTYMFTYVEPQPGSPKLEELLEEYWNLMPEYQASFLYSFLFVILQNQTRISTMAVINYQKSIHKVSTLHISNISFLQVYAKHLELA
jgi:hypothetical protein